MWVMVVVIWTLSNGQLSEHGFVAEQRFSTQAECVAQGRRTTADLSGRVGNVVGAGFMCGDSSTPPPLARGEYEA